MATKKLVSKQLQVKWVVSIDDEDNETTKTLTMSVKEDTEKDSILKVGNALGTLVNALEDTTPSVKEDSLNQLMA